MLKYIKYPDGNRIRSFKKIPGTGFYARSSKRVLKFAFEEMGLNRIECCHLIPNEKSGRVMQKVGMSYEGIAREKLFFKNRYWDVKQYAILKSDWLKRNG